MNHDPLVSVVVIFLDEERFLAEAIDSVLAQTYPHWELILVDDGSTDTSPQIAKGYVSRHPERIRYVTHPDGANHGMSASRNLGVAMARGTLIAPLDGDDVWVTNKLSDQVALLAAHPTAAFVWGPLTRWRSWDGDHEADVLYGTVGEAFELRTDQLYEPPQLLEIILAHKDVLPSGILARRAAIDAVGGSEPSFVGNYEDAVLLVKLTARYPAYCASTSWYRYRIHDASYCRVSRRQGTSDTARTTFLSWAEGYLRDHGLATRSVVAAVRRGLRPYRHPRLHRALLRYDRARRALVGGGRREFTVASSAPGQP